MKNATLGHLGLTFSHLVRLGSVLVSFFTILDHFGTNFKVFLVFFGSKQVKERRRTRKKKRKGNRKEKRKEKRKRKKKGREMKIETQRER